MQNGSWDPRRCAANANAYAHDTSLVALIGPFSSFCAEAALRTLNLAEGGPVPVISPSSTDAGLTRSDGLPVAAGGDRGEPGFYYPTGVRNFVRLQAVDALEGTALAVLAKRLGLKRVYVVLEQGTFFEGQATEPFKRGAKALGVGLAGESSFKTATANPAGTEHPAASDRDRLRSAGAGRRPRRLRREHGRAALRGAADDRREALRPSRGGRSWCAS